MCDNDCALQVWPVLMIKIIGYDVKNSWTPSSWNTKTALQQPTYPDQNAFNDVIEQVKLLPELVLGEETCNLQRQLADVAEGKAFLLQGGDCAESFNDFSGPQIHANFNVILQMAVVLTQATSLPTVKIGRTAGQFAKPRSADTETIDNQTLPSFRGDIINGNAFDANSRIPAPERMLKAYYQSAATLNTIRAITTSGRASLTHVQAWTDNFVSQTAPSARFIELTTQIKSSLDFMKACGVNAETDPNLSRIDFFTSHEALLLPYEEALVRTFDDRPFLSSAHFVWIGDRTRQLDGAHIEFLRGIENPIGLKVGPTMEPSELVTLIKTLNPKNISGKLTLIIRMGHDKIAQHLPSLIEAVKAAKVTVIWSSDPMHGNTHKASNGLKTRSFDRIISELKQFIRIHKEYGTHAGGVHLEMTGQHVTECVGGFNKLTESDLTHCYRTSCDPRLNANQGLELAFLIAEELTL